MKIKLCNENYLPKDLWYIIQDYRYGDRKYWKKQFSKCLEKLKFNNDFLPCHERQCVCHECLNYQFRNLTGDYPRGYYGNCRYQDGTPILCIKYGFCLINSPHGGKELIHILIDIHPNGSNRDFAAVWFAAGGNILPNTI